MRSQPTFDETRVLSQLKFALETLFDIVDQDPSITDRPDSVFVIDGCRIACELRSITPERILALHGLKIETGEVTQLAFPMEPHVWVSNAVQAKAGRVDEYKRRANAVEVWLILHGTSGRMGWDLFTWQKVNGLKVLFEIGAQSFDHAFHKIIVVSDEGNVLEIYDRATSEAERLRLSKLTIQKLPVNIVFFAQVMVTESEIPGEKKVSVCLNDPKTRKTLQPLDKRFRADYGPLETYDWANIGGHGGNSYQTLYALPIE
jgi:hypothetical protein